jgi:hypothetical protein
MRFARLQPRTLPRKCVAAEFAWPARESMGFSFASIGQG